MLTPKRGLKCNAFVSVGHDEYWDIRQFHSAVTMRDAGVDLLFFSGNSVCWVTPFRPSSSGQDNRIIFRGGPYGADNQYALDCEKVHRRFPHHGPDESLLMGARNVEPVNGGGDWMITNADYWMFAGAGDTIPGLIGWEYHGQPADIAGLQVVGAGIPISKPRDAPILNEVDEEPTRAFFRRQGGKCWRQRASEIRIFVSFVLLENSSRVIRSG